MRWASERAVMMTMTTMVVVVDEEWADHDDGPLLFVVVVVRGAEVDGLRLGSACGDDGRDGTNRVG